MENAAQTVLELRNISFAYEASNPTLRNVSATFRRGERIAVLGNNGAGKTTFFLICNRILQPQQGELLHFGKEIGKSKAELMALRRSIGIVFQDPENQIIATTVENEVSFGPMNLRLPMDEVAQRVTQSLAQMNLTDFRQRATHMLSGGEKKRVSIADILAMQPDLIFLDEPTASLDPANVKVLGEILHQLHAHNITVIVSTHDIDFAYQYADRALVFTEGELLADTDMHTVFDNQVLIEQAKIRKPILFEVTQMLQKHGVLQQSTAPIDSLAALEATLDKA